MEIKTTFPLRDGRTAVILKDAYDPNFAIVSGYNPEAPVGQRWDGAIYFDGNRNAFFNALIGIETYVEDSVDIALYVSCVDTPINRFDTNKLIGMLDRSTFYPINTELPCGDLFVKGYLSEDAYRLLSRESESIGYLLQGVVKGWEDWKDVDLFHHVTRDLVLPDGRTLTVYLEKN